jgi:hypothetical protein
MRLGAFSIGSNRGSLFDVTVDLSIQALCDKIR